MTYIIHPKNINQDEIAHLGGKARALAALQQLELPIPSWFVLTPTAFYQSLAPEQWQAMQLGEVETWIQTVQVSEAVETELTQALADLCPNGERVAVRSSASDEDGIQHSFAGQLDSFLFVEPQEVAKRVIAVWQSGFSDRILTYRRENNLHSLPQPPSVLIQRMVDAEVAGVAFSANPVTGQRGVVVVSATYGLGTALVSGECDADSYHVSYQIKYQNQVHHQNQVSYQGEIIQRQIADKQLAYHYDPTHPEKLAAVAVAVEQTKQPALTDEQIRAVAALARRVERHFHHPQDIEWAIAGEQLYLLQARPITALTQMADPDGMPNLWDNSNIVESYGGVTTPLTFSFARRAYEEVYRQFCCMMGVPATAIAASSHVFSHMLGLIQGRVYYNLLNWYRVLALLPGFTVNRRFMEQMMGVKQELPADVLAELTGANWRDRLQDGLRLARTIGGLLTNYYSLPQQIQQFYQRLNHALSLPQEELEEMRPDQLAAYYHDLERQLLTRWDAPLVNDFFAMIFYGVLRKLTEKWCEDSEGTLQNDLISGEGGMISAEPAQRIKQMAQIAAGDEAWVELLCDRPLNIILKQMEQIPALKIQYQAYLNKFGDRCLEELKLESATLHDDPLTLLRSVGQLARRYRSQRIPENISLPSISLREKAEQRVQKALFCHPLRRLVFSWVLQNAKARVRDRENLRFERTRLFGRVRRIFVELGQRFHALDLLNASRDIFYLEVNEILGFIDGTTTCTDLKGLVALRQSEFIKYQEMPAPDDRFETRGVVHQGHKFQTKQAMLVTPDEEQLQGTGCCPGIVRGPVQVITDPKHAELHHGSILVAERTDPGWIMLFPAAAGLLVERGSLLSHSAIVAREMNIPAVVSIPGVTQWLKDGDWVELDGSTGIVRKIESVDVSCSEAPATPPSGWADTKIEVIEVGANG